MSAYEEIRAKGLKRGRKPLPPEEKQSRVRMHKLRQEARRRAAIVLQHNHAEEFKQLLDKELESLIQSEETTS